MTFLLQLLATSLKASLALRGAFFMQAAFMAVNNVLFFAFWWLLFRRFDAIHGWRITDVAALFGVTAAGFGLVMVLAGGLPELARRIEGGDLDAILTQPRDELLMAIGGQTRAAGWGDIGSGIVLVALSGLVHSFNWPLAVLAIAIAATTFAASGVLFHSSAFWLGRTEGVARQAMELLVTFAVYPPPLFGPALKVLLFTVLPAGFISYMPVQMLRDPSWAGVLGASAAALLYAVSAVLVFRRGLRRYESANRFH
jgi:ABC-2 type transport system permease protein